MAQIIRVSSENNANYNLSLNGANYFVRFYWNSYINSWLVDIKDENENYIAMGIVIVANINLLRYSQQLTNSFGEIRAYDFTGGDCENRDEMGKQIVIIYFFPGEYNALFPSDNKIVQREFGYDFDSFFTVV
jgi:hypothetical protein